MPKKDGTATKNEIKQAEFAKRLAALSDRVDRIREGFDALGLEIGSRVSALEISIEQAEEILARFEQIKTTLDLDEGDRFKLRRIRRILEEGAAQ